MTNKKVQTALKGDKDLNPQAKNNQLIRKKMWDLALSAIRPFCSNHVGSQYKQLPRLIVSNRRLT